MKRTAILFLLLLTGVGSAAGANCKAVVPLSVLYVGNSKYPRAGNYESFLKKYFRQVRVVNREGFDPAKAKSADAEESTPRHPTLRQSGGRASCSTSAST